MKSKKKLTECHKGQKHSGNRSSGSDQQDASSKTKSSSQVRRSSNRIKNRQMAVTPKGGSLGLADSAYDADEESVTPGSSPGQQDSGDPYEIEMIEDVPVVSAKFKKKNLAAQKKNNKPKPPSKGLKKTGTSQTTNVKNVPTSTPVLSATRIAKSRLPESSPNDSLSVTPEVTPILPWKPHDCISPSDESFITPQCRRSARKRSLQPDSVSISSQLSYSSQGDSGIAMSPVSKKSRTSASTQRSSMESGGEDFRTVKHKKKNIVINKGMKDQEKLSSGVFGLHFMNKKNIFSPVSQENKLDLQRADNSSRKSQKSKDDSCFGFDSVSSPENSPPPQPKQSKKAKKSKKCTPSKDAYRSLQKDITDSSPESATEKLCLDSESSQENLRRSKSSSPTLFSDTFSGDSECMELDVNRSTSRTYKPTKVKKLKSKKADSKLDVWASNFNMEIEDIQKFDLIIE